MHPRNYLFILITLLIIGCQDRNTFDVDQNLDYCVQQARKTLQNMPADSFKLRPRDIDHGKKQWNNVGIHDWTSGFWPGILWDLYEYTGDAYWKKEADHYTQPLKPISQEPAGGHDIGFMIFDSFGRGYQLTHNPEYKQVLINSADTLATLFNPNVGTILSWPNMVKKMGWPHNTIIDNMMNLELLYWAGKHGGPDSLADIAETHAKTTMQHQIRPDGSTYHVVVYNDSTGKVIKRVTHQGYSDSSMWARGQAWGIYGFTMSYRETKNPAFLNTAKKLADTYIKRLPEDLIPYWDFDAPDIADAPKDASAAAVTASGLLELSGFVKNDSLAQRYKNLAVQMLKELSTDKYQSRDKNNAFLLHSTGSKPDNSEIDVPIIYADYYYLEALLRLKKIREGKSIYKNLHDAFKNKKSDK